MIPIRIEMDYRGLMAELAAKHGVRAMRTIMREAHVEMGKAWHKKYLKKHFERGASKRYGYRQRSLAYKKRKSRERRRGNIQGDQDQDLVFTGVTRLATKTAEIRGFPTRVTIKFPTPRYINMRHRDGRPPLAQELLIVTDAERKSLVKTLMDGVNKRVKALSKKRLKKRMGR